MEQRLFQITKHPALLFLIGLGLAIALNVIRIGSPAKPFEQEILPPASIATISEIRQRPVWVNFLNSKADTSASLNDLIAVGETIKTENDALVELRLKNGTVVRLEGNSALAFKPNNRFVLESGRMLIKVLPNRLNLPGQKANIEVQMRQATALITKGIIYLEVPTNPLLPLQFVCLEGEVKVNPTITAQAINLKTNQSLNVAILGNPQKPSILARADLEKRLAKSQLFENSQPQFPQPNPTIYPAIAPPVYAAKAQDYYYQPYQKPPRYDRAAPAQQIDQPNRNPVSEPKPEPQSNQVQAQPISAPPLPVLAEPETPAQAEPIPEVTAPEVISAPESSNP